MSWESVSMKLFSNYSPCYDCCQAMAVFLRQTKQRFQGEMQIEITFAALYSVNRPSCEKDAVTTAAASEHLTNVMRLKLLKNAGVTLNTFSRR